jgi:hypothetical protein
MTTLTIEHARVARDFLLPHIEASRQMAHAAIAQIPTEVLAIRPVAEGENIGDMAWTLASGFDVMLTGLCEGQFPVLPGMPEAGTAASFVAWDQGSFGDKLQRVSALSGEDLLRPLSFAHITQPAVNFLPLFLANVSQCLGVLSAWLRLHMPGPAPDGELSDADLAAVAGGTGTPSTYFNFSSWLPNTNITNPFAGQLQNQGFPTGNTFSPQNFFALPFRPGFLI